jgi:hypothetical protein
MLNTPSELNSNQDEAKEADLYETTADLEESQAADSEELESTEGDDEQEEVYQIGDKEITASKLEELEKGQMLHADYTRKRQTESSEYKARMGEVDTLLKQIETMEAFIEEDENGTDWDEILSTSELRKVEAKFRERRKKLTELKKQAGKSQGDLSSKVLEATNQTIFSHFKHWEGDDKVVKADQERAYKYALSIGHTDTTISKITDPQSFIALIEAAKYHEIKSAKPETKLKRSTPKTVAQKKGATGGTKSVNELFYGSQE